jgi:hypothetical protein
MRVSEIGLTYTKFMFFVEADYAVDNFKVTIPYFLEVEVGGRLYTIPLTAPVIRGITNITKQFLCNSLNLKSPFISRSHTFILKTFTF